jgi:hypothetical protein
MVNLEHFNALVIDIRSDWVLKFRSPLQVGTFGRVRMSMQFRIRQQDALSIPMALFPVGS